MIKIVSPHANTSLSPIERVLFVVHPWRTGEGGWMASRRQLHEYRANPRSVEYMLDRATEFKAQSAPGAVADVLVEGETLMPEKHYAWIRQIQTVLVDLSGYDTVVLLYPDAIGLGWDTLERTVGDLHAQQCIVINGRRRIFIWDHASRRALAWRRLLYRFSFLEGLFAALLFVASVWFAVADLCAGRTRM